MRVLELHKLQSFPVSCLNRDDAGVPKTCIFGGATRARLSSQTEKSAIKKYWEDKRLEQFKGIRTGYIQSLLLPALAAHGVNDVQAPELAQKIVGMLGKIDAKNKSKVSAMIFISPMEIDRIASAVVECKDDKKLEKTVADIMKSTLPRDAADIVLFGRMFADEDNFSIDAACLVAHPLSVHKSTNEFDFFTAMDMNKPADEPQGAAMMDSAGFVSATFYSYAAVNLDMLKARMPNSAPAEIAVIVREFTEAFALAIPGGRQTTHNAHTRPAFMLATIQTGQPFQLVNAFESPIRANGNGYIEPAIDRLIGYRKAEKAIWGLSYDLEVSVPVVSFPELLAEVVGHV